MKCPRCGHGADMHNDAGSEPIGMMHDHGFIPGGVMCCYAKPDDPDEGVKNWGSKVCGCDYYVDGASVYFPQYRPHSRW